MTTALFALAARSRRMTKTSQTVALGGSTSPADRPARRR